MKYLFQFCLIIFFCLAGEALAHFIPLPIAGGIYGLILLFLCLVFGVVKLEWVADVADWLHGIMALFFIAPAVAIIDIWADISNVWWILVLLLCAAYLVTMITTGLSAQIMIRDKPKKTRAAKK